MRPTRGEFEQAWPRIVRALAAFTGSLDDAEEYAAESLVRAAAHPGPIDELAAWCTSVGQRAWVDAVRRRAALERLTPELARSELARSETARSETEREAMDGAPTEDRSMGSEIDDRLALLFVACDPVLSPTSQMVLALRVVCGLDVREIAAHLGIQETAAAARLTRAKKSLAQARGTFQIPDASEREVRLPVVIDCVAGMFTVAHRTTLDPPDALADTGRQALSIADALVATHPDDPEVRGLRAVIRLCLARRPARLDATGTALPLDEVDRSAWDQSLLAAGLADATLAAPGGGRYAIEAAISGLHTSARTFADTDWSRIVFLYNALERAWPSPSVTVARLAASAHAALATRRVGDLAPIESELEELVLGGAAYASRDAALTLADIEWRTDRKDAAAARYRDLVDTLASEPLRKFCERRASHDS